MRPEATRRIETLTLKLSRTARERLAKTGRLKQKALIAATDAAGNRSAATIALTLRTR